ncbi:MAG: histidinol-phosphatase [Tenericutes bacterium]|nr:histidinol-phosphatase [Mycoplasmatota bacterium]
MSFINKTIRTNYHTHMYLCKHAVGTVDEYVEEAIKNNFTALGMSDHAPWDDLKERSVRMNISDYQIYLKELEDSIRKYSDRIKIYKGLEIEYFKNRDAHYKKRLKEIDYLILGQHYIEMDNKLISVFKIHSVEELTIYKNTVVEAINSGYFKFVAHPDIFLFSSKELNPEILKLSEEIIIAAKEKNIPLEINANGIRRKKIIVGGEERYRYPRLEFWELVKKHNAPCIISSDAHKPEYLYDEAVLEAIEFSRSLSLRVEEELSFK